MELRELSYLASRLTALYWGLRALQVAPLLTGLFGQQAVRAQ